MHAGRQSVAGSHEENGLVSIARQTSSRHKIWTATEVTPLIQVH